MPRNFLQNLLLYYASDGQCLQLVLSSEQVREQFVTVSASGGHHQGENGTNISDRIRDRIRLGLLWMRMYSSQSTCIKVDWSGIKLNFIQSTPIHVKVDTHISKQDLRGVQICSYPNLDIQRPIPYPYSNTQIAYL
jgi:hypothetical protein